MSYLGKDGPQLYFIKLPQQNQYMTLEHREQEDDNAVIFYRFVIVAPNRERSHSIKKGE